MKKLTTVLLFTMILFGQEGWINISPFEEPYSRDNGSFISANEGWVKNHADAYLSEALLHTNDGGATWDTIYVPPPEVDHEVFRIIKVQFVNEDCGFITMFYLTWEYPTYIHTIQHWKTVDGGYTWTDITDPTLMYLEGQTIFYTNSLYFFDENIGFFGGPPDEDRGVILKTVDGGETWYKTDVPNLDGICENLPWPANDFYFVDELHGWAVGSGPPIDAGLAWKTVDGGESWEIAVTPGYPDMNSVHFYDENLGGIAAYHINYSALILTEDNFVTISHNYVAPFHFGVWTIFDIKYASPEDIWVVGGMYNRFYVFYSNDGGDTFENVLFISDENYPINYHDFQLVDNTLFLFLTDRILKYRLDSNSLDDNSSFAKEFSIRSVYPNPFNPTTTIAYDIPHESHVTLTVYDLMGRELETLVNTIQPIGNHQITWDASNYSSGIYLVQLISGEYRSVQKLMLIK